MIIKRQAQTMQTFRRSPFNSLLAYNKTGYRGRFWT